MDTDDSSDDGQTTELLESRQRLVMALYERPYDLVLYLERASVHSNLGYPDLAAGDAYRALLLTDEARDNGFDYHTQTLESLRPYAEDSPAVFRRLEELHIPKAVPSGITYEDHLNQDRAAIELAARASIRCYQILAISLLLCRSLKSAYEFASRGLTAAPGDEELVQAQEYILALARRRLKTDGEHLDINDLPDQGLVRREIYPWNFHEPDRLSTTALDFLNAELCQVAPKCIVQLTELPVLLESAASTANSSIMPMNKQLGLFANEDIAPGELVLDELSILTVNNGLKDTLCDTCSSELPSLSSGHQAVGCLECDDTMFCSQLCYGRAMESYHPAVCDKDLDIVSKDPEESPNALYLLLLARALAMSATQGTHPLNLKEVKYIWGDFLPSATNAVPRSPSAGPPPTWTLPFSFAANISGPLHILEKMDKDIFQTLRFYDLWIFNTLYAKFRGTASARVNRRDGRPEVAGVHPFWSLANHDCDPNVRWEWGGRMKLWARSKRIQPQLEPTIRAGQQILSHFCDIDLPVQERREWAKGSLGGCCMCDRCRKEAAAELKE